MPAEYFLSCLSFELPRWITHEIIYAECCWNNSIFRLLICKLVLPCGMIVSKDPSALIRAGIALLILCLLEQQEEFPELLNECVTCFNPILTHFTGYCKTTGFLTIKSDDKFRFHDIRITLIESENTKSLSKITSHKPPKITKLHGRRVKIELHYLSV